MKKNTLLFLTVFLVYTWTAVGQIKIDSIAKADDNYAIAPVASANIAYSKSNKVVHIAQGSEMRNPTTNALYGPGKIFYMYSTNEGTKWESVGPINKTNDMTLYPALAVSETGTPFIVYRANAARSMMFVTADDYQSATAGLFSTPICVSDTASHYSNTPVVDVSKDGKNVIIAYTVTTTGSKTSYTNSSVSIVVSTDAGKTFTSEKKVLDCAEVMKLYPFSGQNVSQPTVAFGKNGYAIVVAYAVSDTVNKIYIGSATLSNQVAPVYTITTDNGATWSKPAFIPLPKQSDPLGAEYNWWYYWFTCGKPVVDDNNVPHLAANVWNAVERNRLFEFHLSGTTWISNPISAIQPDFTPSSDISPSHACNLSLDDNGNLYAIYSDRLDRAFYNTVNAAVSKDGGVNWLKPFELAYRGHWLYGFDASARTGTKVLALYVNNPSNSGNPSALMMVSCPVDSVLKQPKVEKPAEISTGGYTAAASTYNWIDISTTGTQITKWQNGTKTGEDAMDDGYAADSVALGFDFTFYGQTYKKLYVGINGLVSFTQKYLNTASQIKSPGIPDTVSGFFDDSFVFPGTKSLPQTIGLSYYDLTIKSADGFPNAKILYQSFADKFVVSYENVGTFDAGDLGNSFQLILNKNNTITVQFKKMGLSATYSKLKIGIQKNDTLGIAWVKNGYPLKNLPKDGYAVTFGVGTTGPKITKNLNIATEVGWKNAIAKGLLFKPGKILDNGNTIWLCGHEIPSATGRNSWTFLSTDGGTTFKQGGQITGRVSNVDAFSKTDAVVGTADGKILKTTDGGMTWKEKHSYTLPSAVGFFDGIKIVGENSVVAFGDGEAGSDLYVCRSTDKGETFTVTPQSSLPPYGGNIYGYFSYGTCMESVGNNIWFATYGGGTNGYVFRSTDAGATWKSTELTTANARFNSIAFNSATEGMGVDNGRDVFYTSDGGVTWTKVTKPSVTAGTCTTFCVAAVPNTSLFVAHGIVVNGTTNTSGAFYSNDKGTTWNQIAAPLTVSASTQLLGGLYLNENTGYALSTGAWVLKLSTATPTKVETANGTMPTSYSLYQNYPNPFNPSTTIMYDLPKSSRVVLKIYNSLGQEVKTLVDGLQNTGKYTISFDASTLSSGVYFYRLSADSYNDIKKMMFIK